MPYKNKEDRNNRQREFRKENLELVRKREREIYAKNKERLLKLKIGMVQKLIENYGI